MARIGMLLMGGSYPPDIRVAKEAKVLSSAGHEVFLLTSDKNGRTQTEQLDGMTVVRYPARSGWLASKYSAVVTYATWRSPLWQRWIDRFVTEHGIDALHVHDLPAVATATRVARRRAIPVVYDMHENYPAAVGFWKRGRLPELLQTPARYRVYERRAVESVDRVVVVVDESRERLVAMGVDPARVSVFTNVDDDVAGPMWEPENGSFTIAYAGGFGEHRGLDVLVRAFKVVKSRVPEAKLLLMGAGDGEAELKSLVAREDLEDSVEFTGWIGLDEMRSRLAGSSVGAVPHLRNEHTDSTVPHKLFQYMGMGLPLVVTDCAPLARIVRDTDAGAVAVAGDADSLAQAILGLRDRERALAVSAAGKDAVFRCYNLATEGMSLVGLYSELL